MKCDVRMICTSLPTMRNTYEVIIRIFFLSLASECEYVQLPASTGLLPAKVLLQAHCMVFMEVMLSASTRVIHTTCFDLLD